MSKRVKPQPTNEKANCRVKRVEPFTTWEGNGFTRLDMSVDGPSGGTLHLYVPTNHPLAKLTKGAKVKVLTH
jgi:hypothetical protein